MRPLRKRRQVVPKVVKEWAYGKSKDIVPKIWKGLRMREHRKSKEPALRSPHRRLTSTCLEKQREPN